MTPQGFRLGTFCAIDDKPRESFSDDQNAALRDFAAATMQMLQLRQLANAERSRDENQIAEHARADSFSIVAHELRSPMADLGGYKRTIESVAFGPLSDRKYSELPSAMSDTIEQSQTMTDRMLDLARLKTGEIELAEEWLSVPAVLNAAKRNALLAFGNTDARIEVAASPHEVQLSADAVFLSRMLDNLIGNAIRYGNDRSAVEVQANVDIDGILEIIVSDNGTGMSPDDLAYAL